MYYSFRQILKEKMSKLSDDLKDEEILIQLAETNESIFQIIIKTGADDDMNAILAQEPILTICATKKIQILWYILIHISFKHGLILIHTCFHLLNRKKHYHEKTTLINSVIDKVTDAYDQFCKFEKEFDDESRK